METRDLLVELGTEELPPKSLKSLGLALRDGIVAGLEERELEHGAVRWFAAPRRLAVLVRDVAEQAADKTLEVLGPPAERAKDEAGNWTPAAQGFARKQGMEPEALELIDTPKGQRLGVRQQANGIRTRDCLNEVISASIGALPIPKRMRWGDSREEFVRPVHWIVAMFGTDADHGEILGIPTGNITQGHRVHGTGPITLAAPGDYEDALAAQKVVVDFEQRRQMIRDQVETEASALQAEAVIDPDLLDEVTGLVEWPVALTGSFERRFLSVPTEALISSMKEHQKYFHVVDGEGQLLPNFITISNIESRDPSQVIDGNERVIRPRLSDAAFFFETDKKTPLADRLESLQSIVFQQKLGSLHDKSSRVAALAKALAPAIGADPEQAHRAGMLSKADLATDMVLEFADMQGIAGSHYARNDGEPEDVAAAIEQQYWPRFAGDRLPDQPVATCVALADRLDTLVGIFGIGQPPTGSRDPFGLRRASLGVLRILVENGFDLDLADCLAKAEQGYPAGTLEPGTGEQVLAYMIERFRAWYEDENIPVEVFKSVSALGLSRPLDIQRRVHAVAAFTALPQAAALAAANKRVSNILAKLDDQHSFGEVNASLLHEPEEQSLSKALDAVSNEVKGHLAAEDCGAALKAMAVLQEPVDAFFDDVMVNADDAALRENRLNLLKALRDLFLQVADISHLVVSSK